jgi:hypothetical protein
MIITAPFPGNAPDIVRKEVTIKRDEDFETINIYVTCHDRSFDDGNGTKTGRQKGSSAERSAED